MLHTEWYIGCAEMQRYLRILSWRVITNSDSNKLMSLFVAICLKTTQPLIEYHIHAFLFFFCYIRCNQVKAGKRKTCGTVETCKVYSEELELHT